MSRLCGIAHRKTPILWPTHRNISQLVANKKSKKAINFHFALPSEESLESVRGESSTRSEAEDIVRFVEAADAGKLLHLSNQLVKLPRARGQKDPTRPAWDAVAHQCIELSRLGNGIDSPKGWARFLGNFSRARVVNPALLQEVDYVLVRDDALLAAASIQELGSIVAALDRLQRPCSTPLLQTVAKQLGALDKQSVEEDHLDVASLGALAGAFARAHVHSEEVVSFICKRLLKSEELLLVGDAKDVRYVNKHDDAVASLSLFHRTFGLPGDSECSGLLHRAMELSGRCSLGQMAMILPFLAASREPAAAAAVRRAIRGRLRTLLERPRAGVASLHNSEEEREAVPHVLEAMALVHERDLSTVVNLSFRALNMVSRLGLDEITRIATALAQLQVRQEILMDEMAEAIVVRHQPSLCREHAESVLLSWTALRTPHTGLTAALRSFLEASDPVPHLEVLLEQFEAVTPPGSGLTTG